MLGGCFKNLPNTVHSALLRWMLTSYVTQAQQTIASYTSSGRKLEMGAPALGGS